MPTRLDPEIENILPLLPVWDMATLTPQAARETLLQIARSRNTVPLPQTAAVADQVVSYADGDVTVRVFRPTKHPAPTVLYFHGGGWVAGDLETSDRIARTLSIELDAVVVSVDYRRPPEAPFPIAFNDCLAVTRWVATHIASLGGDATRIGVAGDSAGGGLAASVALACRGDDAQLKAQLLIYPATDLGGTYRSEAENAKYASRQQNAVGYFLTTELMAWFAGHFLANAADELDWRASPLRARSLSGLPPAVICTAGFDPLRDEGEAYAYALQQAGVEVYYRREPDLIHGYFAMAAASVRAAHASRNARAAFKALLDR